MGLLQIDKITKSIEGITKNISGIFKATDKGVLSSRRTISGLIVAFALFDMESNGINQLNLIVLALGILPVALLTFSKHENTNTDGTKKI